ncbi:MAG: aldehyde dehydrogenase family protein [Chloroflexi bacterium]|nr:aldehyde dehydrogenase family protein [Chloroflexota bacterium]
MAAARRRPAAAQSAGARESAAAQSAGAREPAAARSAGARAVPEGVAVPAPRIDVRKTWKLYIGGAFPRTESGRSYLVTAADGTPLANACRGSRKDLRDAVRAARKAFPGWADRAAMNRGQILYRVAELMEGRREQFVAEVEQAEGLRPDRARAVVDRAIDRWVWYAGWADKIAQVLGSSNPVAGSYFNFTIPEPTGVVGIVAPETSSLLGLVSRLAPPLVAGNAVVVITSEGRPLPAVTLTEVLATSDVPGGVVNVITGFKKELAPVLAGHVDVDAIDVWGVEDATRREIELLATDNVKRIVRRPAGVTDARFDWLDDRAAERPEWIAAYMEMKTVWHPIGV